MKRAFVLAIIMLFAISGLANAAKPVASGSIDVTGTPIYQHALTFTWSAQDYKGFEYPLVLVTCHQPSNPYAYSQIYPQDITYRELGLPTDTFVIGGGSSAYVQWVNEGGSTAASCEAELYLYPGSIKHPPIFLDRDEFIVP